MWEESEQIEKRKDQRGFPHFEQIFEYAKRNLKSTMQAISLLEYSMEALEKVEQSCEIKHAEREKRQFGETLIYFCGRKLISDQRGVGIFSNFSDQNNRIQVAIFQQVIQASHHYLSTLFHIAQRQNNQDIEYSSFDISIMQPIQQKTYHTYYFDHYYQTWMFAFNTCKQQEPDYQNKEIHLDDNIQLFIKQEISMIISLIFQKQQLQDNSFGTVKKQNFRKSQINENLKTNSLFSHNPTQLLISLCHFHRMTEPVFARKQIIKNELFEVSVSIVLNRERVSVKGQGQSWKGAKRRGCELMLHIILENSAELWTQFVEHRERRQKNIEQMSVNSDT